MTRRITKLASGAALALTIVAATAASPAAAFDTGPHTDITTEALRDEGFGTPAADIAGVNNYWVDLYSQAGETPYSGHASWYKELLAGAYFDREHWSQAVMDAAGQSHFDNQHVRPLTDTASVEREWLHLRRIAHMQMQRARQHQDPLEVITVIGQTLHPVQDFYTHTNWIEPSGANESPGWASKGQGSVPTWFDVPKQQRDAQGVRIFPGSVPGDEREHGNWQQDGNLSLKTATAKDWPGRPLYNEAYMSSYFASRTWVQALRDYLGDDALWNRARAYAQNLSSLKFDKWGAYNVPAYVGHWSGEGGVCKYVVTCGGPEAGAGGSLVGARWATNKYFEDRPGGTIFRKTFYRLITGMGETPPAVPESQLAVPSSRAIQEQTQFVRLRMTKIGGGDLTDPGWDDADLYGRATIDGHDFISAMIQGHDTFSFPRPYAPFTWLKPVSRGSYRGQPVETMTVRIKTSSSTWSGTDDDVYLRTSNGERFLLDKVLYDDFERGDDDTYSVPIDEIARRGFTVGDIQMLQIEKSRDGAAGGWKLQSFSVSVNGGQIYASGNINKWLEKNSRTYRAPNFTPRAPQTTGVPVWMDLMEDDIVYGDDDQGDVNRLDARNAHVRTYVPGSAPLTESLVGGKQFGGRLNRGGDFTKLTYTVDTVNPVLWTPPRPIPDVQHLPDLEVTPDPKPTTPTPTTPETGKPDLVVTELEQQTVTVKNQGTATAPASTLRVSPSKNVAIPALAPGQSITRVWNDGSCPDGTWTATADFLGQVDESNESNNSKVLQLIC